MAAFTELLASDGADVPLYRVARQAGVGQATLYRHFPERALLAAAIYEHRLGQVAALAAARAGDPRAFLLLIQALIEEETRTPGLLRVLREGREGERYFQYLTNRVLELLDEPLRTARAAGTVRGDFQLDDVQIVFAMLEGAVEEADASGRPQFALRAFELLARGVAEPGKWPAASSGASGVASPHVEQALDTDTDQREHPYACSKHAICRASWPTGRQPIVSYERRYCRRVDSALIWRLTKVKRMLWPRILYWTGFVFTMLWLCYGITGLNGTPGLAARSTTQTGSAILALVSVAAMMAAKAWMDAVVRARSRASCPSCNTPVHVANPHCAACGAPQRTTPEMLRTLANASHATRPESPQACPGCGAPCAADAGFCRSCGRSLSPTSELVAA